MSLSIEQQNGSKTTFRDGSIQKLTTHRKTPFVTREILPFLIAMTSGFVCYAIFFRRGLGLSVIGYSISPAERVMNGEVPYRDFLFNYTPGVLWVNALLMKLFGASLMTIRAGLFVFKMLTLGTLFLVAKRLTNPWAALVPVALSLAWLGHRQPFNVYPDQYLLFFALLALSLMLRYNDSGNTRWLFFCGIATGAVLIFKHNVGLLLLAPAIASIIMREALSETDVPRSRRAVSIAYKSSIHILGFVMVGGALATYLVYHQAFGAMIQHFLHHAAEYSETRAIGLPGPGQIRLAAGALIVMIATGVLVFYKAPRLLPSYLVLCLLLGSAALLIPGRAYALKESSLALTAYFPIVIFSAALVSAILQIRKTFREEGTTAEWWRTNSSVVITGLFALGIYLEVFPRADNYHLVRVLPPVMLFFLAWLARSLGAMRTLLACRAIAPRSSLLIACLPLCYLFFAGLLDCWRPQFDARFQLKDNTELSLERGRGVLVERRQAELADGLVALIQNNSNGDDPIFSFSQRGSSLYFLANRRNPSRLLWWSSVGITREDRESVFSMIQAGIPKLIVVQDIPANKHIRDFIGPYYNHIGTVSDIEVYGRIQ